MLWIETGDTKRLFEGVFALHCPFGLYILKCHLLDPLVENLERSESMASTDTRLSEQFKVLNEQSYRVMSRQLSTRRQETVRNTDSTRSNVRKVRDVREATQCEEAVLKTRQCFERPGGYLARDCVCFSLDQLLGTIESRGMVLSVKSSHGRILVELLREEALKSSPKCVRGCVLVDRTHVHDEDVQAVFVKSGSISRASCPTLNEYNRAADKRRILRSGHCVLLEQGLYAIRESGSERRILNSAVVVRGEGVEGEEI